MANRIGRRVAIVAGLRTPFVKAGTVFKNLTALDLGRMVTAELIQRAGISAKEIDQVVFGTVIHHVAVSNIAREISMAAGIPKTAEAYTVSRACATSLQALTSAADSIAQGTVDVALVGGTESMTDVPITLSRPLAQAMVLASKGKTLFDKVKAFSSLNAKDVLPVPPAIAEFSTGESMGESAEKMAKENGITRAAQDAFAHRSHVRAARAWADGTFAEEVMHVLVPPKYEPVSEDNIFRKDSTLESYERLKPVFDRKFGSITAGNASPLTDGASALIVMAEEKAKALGILPLGYMRSYAYAGVDPGWQLLQAPAFSVPKALQRAGLRFPEIDLFEIHEAFAAQVLSNLQAWSSKAFADKHLGGQEPLGEVPEEKMNVHGGSISLGHPFAATGARMVTQALRELGRQKKQTALLSVCAAGGLGAAVVLERE